MKKQISEIRGEDSTELKAMLNDLHKEQFNLRFRGSDDTTKNTRPREVRRKIARILMVLGERTRTGETKGTPQAPAAAPAKKAKATKTATKEAKTTKAAKPAAKSKQ
jgi:large subunit ribosomal protein L29